MLFVLERHGAEEPDVCRTHVALHADDRLAAVRAALDATGSSLLLEVREKVQGFLNIDSSLSKECVAERDTYRSRGQGPVNIEIDSPWWGVGNWVFRRMGQKQKSVRNCKRGSILRYTLDKQELRHEPLLDTFADLIEVSSKSLVFRVVNPKHVGHYLEWFKSIG